MNHSKRLATASNSTHGRFMHAFLLVAMAILSLGMSAGSGAQPLPSVLDPGVTQVAAGGGHSCALTTAGAVKCWGQNTYGQLGNGSTTSSPIPVTSPASAAAWRTSRRAMPIPAP